MFRVNEARFGSQRDGGSSVGLLQGPSHPAKPQGLAETLGLDPDPHKYPVFHSARKKIIADDLIVLIFQN